MAGAPWCSVECLAALVAAIGRQQQQVVHCGLARHGMLGPSNMNCVLVVFCSDCCQLGTGGGQPRGKGQGAQLA
jgi:hypothetical protein